MTDSQKKRVLVVDDSEQTIDILVEALSGEYRVIVAMDGESALEVIGKNPPDLVLLDIMLPGIDGYEVCRRLMDDPDTKDLPVIFVSAKTGGQEADKARAMGAKDYIEKPLDTSDLLARVAAHI